jgi:mannosyltransferase OCH1-like enzyme
VDSVITKRLDDFIEPADKAVISFEKNPGVYVQWALVYEAGHPFLQKTLQLILENISQNKYPNDVHQMTGPSVYTKAINECLHSNPNIRTGSSALTMTETLNSNSPFPNLCTARASTGRSYKKPNLF